MKKKKSFREKMIEMENDTRREIKEIEKIKEERKLTYEEESKLFNLNYALSNLLFQKPFI